MAKDIGDLIVKLSLDSAQFESGMEKFEKQMTKLQSQYRSSATGVTDFDKVVTKLEGSAKTLTERVPLRWRTARCRRRRTRVALGVRPEDGVRVAHHLVGDLRLDLCLRGHQQSSRSASSPGAGSRVASSSASSAGW